jgi:hypothetical protein
MRASVGGEDGWECVVAGEEICEIVVVGGDADEVVAVRSCDWLVDEDESVGDASMTLTQMWSS